MAIDLSTALERLSALKPELRERFAVSAIFVFGSVARGEEEPGSDLDLLVDFAPGARPTLFSLADLDRVLQAELGVTVDVTPRKSLNPRLAPYIQAELVAVTRRRLARPLLEDMKAYAEEARDYLGDRTGDDIARERMRFLALARAAEIVGEAAGQVPMEVRAVLTGVDFRSAVAMRHRLAHGYGAIDATILADTIRNDFPSLIAALNTALEGRLPDEVV